MKEGEEIHLHFQSQNKEEQNGAVLMTFQSNIPGYKGLGLSKPNSLVQTAAIRTICHMLREPLFNQLRTKEQLGYIVSSYYDNSMSSNHNQIDFSGDNVMNEGSTPIDSVVLKVLSKKVPPTVVTKRIDEFLGTFREKLRYVLWFGVEFIPILHQSLIITDDLGTSLRRNLRITQVPFRKNC